MRQNPRYQVIGVEDVFDPDHEEINTNGDIDAREIMRNAGISLLVTSYGVPVDENGAEVDEDVDCTFLPFSLEGYRARPINDIVYQAPRGGLV